MDDRIILSPRPLQPSRWAESLVSEEDGALLCFSGHVRRTEGERRLRGIDYQAYESMARAKLEELLSDAHRRWPAFRAVIAHRMGEVAVGEASVWIAVATAHREEAYLVSRFLIDELKAKVPIWKREHLPD